MSEPPGITTVIRPSTHRTSKERFEDHRSQQNHGFPTMDPLKLCYAGGGEPRRSRVVHNDGYPTANPLKLPVSKFSVFSAITFISSSLLNRRHVPAFSSHRARQTTTANGGRDAPLASNPLWIETVPRFPQRFLLFSSDRQRHSMTQKEAVAGGLRGTPAWGTL
jgi:hypothetical protein